MSVGRDRLWPSAGTARSGGNGSPRCVDRSDLVQLGGYVEVAQAVGADPLDAQSLDLAGGHDRLGRRDHLTPVAGAHDSCRLMEREGDVVTVPGEGDAGVQAHAHADDAVVRPGLRAEPCLRVDRRREAVPS